MEPLSSFLYDDIDSEKSSSYVPLSDFGIEFQHDPQSRDQTYYNFSQWYRKNEPDGIGALPSPFFEDFMTLLTMRAFGEIDETFSQLSIKDDEVNTEQDQ